VAGHAFAGVNWVGSKPQGYLVRDARLNAKSLRDWVGAGEDITSPVFRDTSKVSRQVLRFFKTLFSQTGVVDALRTRATANAARLPVK
jgi:hypothetical protein